MVRRNVFVDERRDIVGKRMSKIMLAAGEDVQSRVRQKRGKALADGDRTDWVGVSPQEQGRRCDRADNRRQVELEFRKPLGQSGIRFDELRPPVMGAQIADIQTAGSHREDKVRDQLRALMCSQQGDHASHGLGNDGRRLIDLGDYPFGEIANAVDGGITRGSSKAGPSEMDVRCLGAQQPGHRPPEVRVARGAWKE
jgi:hypothetical protein